VGVLEVGTFQSVSGAGNLHPLAAIAHNNHFRQRLAGGLLNRWRRLDGGVRQTRGSGNDGEG
jgi:hypothetical protein